MPSHSLSPTTHPLSPTPAATPRTARDPHPAPRTRRADGIGDECVAEQHAFARQPVEVRCLVDDGPVRTDRVRRVIVGEDEHDVGPHRLATTRSYDECGGDA